MADSLLSTLGTKGPNRFEVGRKELTLAFGGKYIASTTVSSKPILVWERDGEYPQYYIPADTLHADIQLPSSSSQPKSSVGNVKLESVEEVKSENGKTVVAAKETLTVGGKSTAWVRFFDGPLKGYIRFERQELDAWFQNGSISVAIKNPYKRIDTTPVSHNIVVKIDGEKVAETNVAVLLSETGQKEAYYLPATSVLNWGALEKTELRTTCPYKGEAWYFSITVKGKKWENQIWYYQYPTHESAGVEGFISFYNKEGVDILVDGVKV